MREERRKEMTSEQRLDRMERILRLVVRAGARERKETREKINALIDAHLRIEAATERFQARTDDFLFRLEEAQLHTEEALADLARGQGRLKAAQVRTEEAMTRLAQAQARTDERLNSFIDTVERVIQERRDGDS
jgi:hypothetical protein